MGETEKAREAARLWRKHNPQLKPQMIARLLPMWSHDQDYIDLLHEELMRDGV